ncbi:hypothetical protein [Flavobacterium ajazii]|uniref:hypothetical protein n=1 Tax=Flavobacterium ajazii TaxID=2692318 RepID=UPI0013D25F2A|nr:hypothetical protein [Flavobacterium ajazii]
MIRSIDNAIAQFTIVSNGISAKAYDSILKKEFSGSICGNVVIQIRYKIILL